MQKINDQHVLTDKPEKSLQDAVQDPNQLQEQEMYFAQIISDKEEVLLAHKHEAAQKMNVLNNRVKELNKNYTDQTKHVHDLKKTIENHENTIKSLETTIKEVTNN